MADMKIINCVVVYEMCNPIINQQLQAHSILLNCSLSISVLHTCKKQQLKKKKQQQQLVNIKRIRIIEVLSYRLCNVGWNRCQIPLKHELHLQV